LVYQEPRDLKDGKFSYEGQKLKLPFISIWYKLLADSNCCLEVNFKCYRLKLIKIWRNLKFSYILILFDLQWLKLTFKQQNLYIFRISEQFSIRKSTISIFNFQGVGAPEKPKKNSVRRNWFYISPQFLKGQTRSISTKL
jgi:hypothetical protein